MKEVCFYPCQFCQICENDLLCCDCVPAHHGCSRWDRPKENIFKVAVWAENKAKKSMETAQAYLKSCGYDKRLDDGQEPTPDHHMLADITETLSQYPNKP